MVKTAVFGEPCVATAQPGKCRICGCTEDRACVILVGEAGDAARGDRDASRPCDWTDASQTLCDNPDCIAEAKREIGVTDGAR